MNEQDDRLASEVYALIQAGETSSVRSASKRVLEAHLERRPMPTELKSLMSAVKRMIDDEPGTPGTTRHGTGGGRRVIRDPRGL